MRPPAVCTRAVPQWLWQLPKRFAACAASRHLAAPALTRRIWRRPLRARCLPFGALRGLAGHFQVAAFALLAALLTTFPGNWVRADETPSIAIIIDDLGNLRTEGLQALELPGPLTYAVLPHTPHAAELSDLAYELGKEVMLHLPMQAHSGKSMGPGGISLGMDRNQFEVTLRRALVSVPNAVGVSNHMGSLLTTKPEPMHWLMSAIQARGGLYFVDSRTDPASVAFTAAHKAGLPSAQRDVFLDHVRSTAAINSQFDRLIEIAKSKGLAVGIGHPYAETMQVLASRLGKLSASGVRLIKASRAIHLKKERAR